MSLFDLQDVCIAIGSIATLDLPMIVDLIGIYGLKGPYCTLTTTNWFLQALSVILGDHGAMLLDALTMIRWTKSRKEEKTLQAGHDAAASRWRTTPPAARICARVSLRACRNWAADHGLLPHARLRKHGRGGGRPCAAERATGCALIGVACAILRARRGGARPCAARMHGGPRMCCATAARWPDEVAHPTSTHAA
ncbi:hypothetical protein F511_17253 [Dorcoceras hygrometricum]|uniref:Acyl-CoA dehydrogenase-related protein n=1 Tax=Dorcoceras hygrometricum TaxID=472368 RepID=A0A2Z7BXH6_9LAMI|nr:hypothetical protein F511_17253 [Dorcoceras hygrometricum]